MSELCLFLYELVTFSCAKTMRRSWDFYARAVTDERRQSMFFLSILSAYQNDLFCTETMSFLTLLTGSSVLSNHHHYVWQHLFELNVV